MRYLTKYALFGLVAMSTAVFGGCMSQKVGVGLGAVVLASILKDSFDPVFELAFASNEFREAKKRWPKDYGELSNFLKQTDNKTFQAFQAVNFQRVEFAEVADGKLRINAEFTFGSGGTGKIEGMEISAVPTAKKSE